jgi:hypothetical protein
VRQRQEIQKVLRLISLSFLRVLDPSGLGVYKL